MEFAYDGSGFAKAFDVTLCVDGTNVGGVEATQPLVFSGDAGCGSTPPRLASARST